LYGPQAVKRFYGWDNRNQPAPNVNIIVPPAGGDQQAIKPEVKKPNLRGTNPEALALAWKFIGFGDAHFNNQKYSEALQRYRKAVRGAPQLADGYFRQGYALAAIGRYDLATRAIKRGLRLDPGWPRSNFSNNVPLSLSSALPNWPVVTMRTSGQ
jgi:tetratricopeptide (TPR) repeat protein